MSGRSTARDGALNRLEFYLTTHFRPVWELVQKIPPVRRWVNRFLINRAINRIPPRPYPLSTKAPYTSWDSLTDRTYAARHLPPVPPVVPALPPARRTADLFARDGTRLDEKSTVLFAHFAQWFTDGFLRTDRTEPRHPGRTTSLHEVDLSQLYGLRPSVTGLLRAKVGGELKSQCISGEEFPAYLCAHGAIKPEFEGIEVLGFERLTGRQRDSLFAMGGDRANSQAGYAMFNVLFLREHNRIARLLVGEHPEWDDERLFATARNVVTVLLIKIVIEEYINHITPYHFRFRFEPGAIGRDLWYRTNWMAIEFNLLYRWHSLVPDTLRLDGRDVPIEDTLYDNSVLTERGLGAMFDDSSRQPAGRIGLRNTTAALWETEVQSVVQAREVALASYNDYRQYCGYPRVTRFDQISSDPDVCRLLQEHYGTVDRIEYYPGLFAEDVRPASALPPLIGRMVGIDAFSQVLTNPLLAPLVYGERTLSALGLRIVEGTRSLTDLLHRNVPAGQRHLVTMTRTDWRR